MTRKQFFIFFVIIFNLSCKNRSEKSSFPIVDHSAVKIDFDRSSPGTQNLADLIEVKNIIPIETTDKFYISNINKCVRIDSTLFVLDAKFSKLLSYSITGKFLHEIGKLGNGVGEFENISGFFIDENINIFSSESMKIITFDKIGNFISEKKVPFFAQDVVKINNNKYAFYIDYNSSPATDYFNTVLTDSLLKVTNYFFSYPKNPHGTKLEKITGGLFQSSNDLSLTYNAFQDSIFQVTNNNNSLSLKYVINISKNKIPDSIKADPSNLFKANGNRIFGYNQLYGPVYETDSLLSFSYLENRVPQGAIYFKQSKLLLKNSSVSGFTKYLGKTVGVFENNFISCISADTYLRTILNWPEVEKYLKNNNPILHKHLSTMYKTQANPVLIVWGLKK